MSGGGLAMRATGSRLDRTGVFVRARLAPKAGSKVRLKIALSGETHPLDVGAVVGAFEAALDRSGDTGFWASFESLDPETSRRLVAALGPVAGPERREHPRIPARLEVQLSEPRSFLLAYSEDLSRGGLFVSTDARPALGTDLDLAVALPDGMPPLSVRARVVRHDDSRRGIGLQLPSDDSIGRRLEHCMDVLLLAPS